MQWKEHIWSQADLALDLHFAAHWLCDCDVVPHLSGPQFPCLEIRLPALWDYGNEIPLFLFLSLFKTWLKIVQLCFLKVCGSHHKHLYWEQHCVFPVFCVHPFDAYNLVCSRIVSVLLITGLQLGETLHLAQTCRTGKWPAESQTQTPRFQLLFF